MSAEALRNSTGESLDLKSEISKFFALESLQSQQKEIYRVVAKKEAEESLRLWKEEKAQRDAEEAALVLARNERGKEIVIVSGVREMIEEARIGLNSHFQNATTAEGMGLNEYPFQRESYEEQKKQHKLYMQGKEDYVFRLAWDPQNPTQMQNIIDYKSGTRSGEDDFGGFNYIDVWGDGWNNLVGIRDWQFNPYEPCYNKITDTFFEVEEWKNSEKLAKAILEATKHPIPKPKERWFPSLPSREKSWVEKMEYRKMMGEHG